MLKLFKSDSLIKNFAIALGIFIAYLVLSMLFTNFYTRHGESVKVPNVTGMPAENAFANLDDQDLEMIIVDSVYREDMKPMTIVDQDPKPDMKVKPGRKIYVTVNSGVKPKVKMPQLVNQSANLAKVLLQNSGLVLGRIDSVSSSLGSGLVIDQKYKGQSIPARTLVEKGAIIDIKVTRKQNIVDSSSVAPDAVPDGL